MTPLLGQLLDDRHAAVEVGVEPEHQRAVGEGLHELRRGDLAARKQHHDRQARRGAVRRQRRARVAGGSAGDGLDREPALHGQPHHADEHGHAEILERPEWLLPQSFTHRSSSPSSLP